MEALVKERKEVREKIQVGRDLLELDRRVRELEQKLMLAPKGKDDRDAASEVEGEEEDSEDESAEDEDEEDNAVPVKRLRRRMQQYMLILQLAEKLGLEHPFVVEQEVRRERLRETLLLDMGSATKSAVETDGEGREGQLYMIGTYELMGAAKECMEVLKEARGGQKNEKGKET